MFNKMKLFSGASFKMLSVLALDSMRVFVQRELAKEAGVSVGSASENLPALIELGLVRREKKGNVYLLRYNADSVVARQFKVLLNVIELIDLVESLKPHVKRVVLYGSAASGTDVKDSDIDLFILATDKKKAADTVNSYKTDRWLSPLIVDVNELTLMRKQDAPLYEETQKGIVLWETE
jgi:predicted nucleotidyltransferase